jgi:hypothetical protein
MLEIEGTRKMAELVSNATVGTVTIAIPISAAAGTVMGIEIITMGAAFIGGTLVLLYVPRMPWARCFFSVFGATLIGGFVGQVVGTVVGAAGVYGTMWLIPNIDPMSVVTAIVVPIKITLALFTGLVSLKAIPALLERITRWGKGKPIGDEK